MSWTSRRRARASSSESSPLEVDRSYATFTGSSFLPRKQSGILDILRGGRIMYSLWTMTSVAIAAMLFYKSIRHFDSNNNTTTPISLWDHNHYVSRDAPRQRNLLIAQVGKSQPPFAEITSKPNRAYARRWRWDYLLHTEKEDDCSTVRVLNHILARQEEGEADDDDARAPYDAILFLSPDAVIMDLDYQFLALLPNEKLVAAGETKSNLFIWNLDHPHSLDVARMWMELGDDSKCDMESLWSAIEMTMGGDKQVFDLSTYVQPLQLSPTGLVEPRLIKFLPNDSDENLAVGMLESVADSVCYRYYPRCEVL